MEKWRLVPIAYWDGNSLQRDEVVFGESASCPRIVSRCRLPQMFWVLYIIGLPILPNQMADNCVMEPKLTINSFDGHSCQMHSNYTYFYTLWKYLSAKNYQVQNGKKLNKN